MIEYFFTLAFFLFCYMNVWFIFSILKKRNDVADVAWGLGFVLLAWVSFALNQSASVLSLFVSVMVTIWGVRLSLHIWNRNKGKGEDYRYQKWRNEWGKWFYIRSYFQVYILQGVLLFIIALPFLLINQSSANGFGIVAAAGFVVWLVGFFFEVVGDWQLSNFLKKPENKGKLIMNGLWAYTRHPNYFGEVTCWWGIWIMSLSICYGFWGVFGPLTITFLILKVSGVPLLEQKMSQHPDFESYSKRVSVFFPLPPRAK